MELVIASRNVHKIRELRAILREYPHFDLHSLLDFPQYKPPEEIGKTFEENAKAKAIHAAAHLKKWAIGEDSGLVVPALQGAPGVYSARYAGVGATDAENRHKLLREMRDIAEPQRQGFFECWIAIASPEGLQKTAKGICEGTILSQEKGSRGFGYDALFVKYEYGKSFAEIEETLKNRISHRRKALDKLHVYLSSFQTPTFLS